MTGTRRLSIQYCAGAWPEARLGAPLDLYRQPDNTFVAQFIGAPRMNMLTGALADRLGGAQVGIRPEHMTLATRDPILTGRVAHAEHLGADTIAHVETAGGARVVIRIDGATPLETGQTVGLTAAPGNIHTFAPDGTRIAGGHHG